MSQFKKISALLALTMAGLLAGVGCTGEIDDPVDTDEAAAPSLTTQDAPPPPKKPPGQTQNPNPGK